MLEPGSRPQTLRDFESVLAFRNHISDLPIPPLQIALYTFFAILGPLFLIRLGRWIDTTLSERAIPVEVPLPGPARPAWRGENLSNPSITDSAKPGKIVCYDPATAYHLADIDADTPATIEEKIEKATHAQISWAQSEFGARRRLMNTLKKWIVDDMENIARVAARDTGKTAIDAAFGELLTTCSKLEWTSANGEKVLAPETRPNNLLLAHKRCQVWHEPLGVVAALVSWNYSAHNVLGPIIASLFAGNAIVVKSSELVAWSSAYFISGVRECLRACGADPELVQLVTCFPDAAPALTTSARIAHITFIGSEPIGKLVAQAATKELTPVTLELGGKDPAVLLESADLKYFNSTFMRSCFQAVGQNCIGIERFIVHSAIVSRFVATIEPRIRALRCGSFLDDTPFVGIDIGSGEATQVDCGAMITDARFDRLEELVRDAVKRGAKCIVGGERYQHPKWTKGHYFQPTLVVDVTPDMPIAQEELFAPIFLVLSFSTLSEAVSLANSTRYGLGSSIFSSNRAEALAVARALDCGMVNINDFGVSYLNQGLPFGGTKKSGYGRFAGPEGLRALTAPKAVTQDRFFGWLRTGIPKPLDYPLKDALKSWKFVQSLVLFAYGDMRQKARGLAGLIRGSV